MVTKEGDVLPVHASAKMLFRTSTSSVSTPSNRYRTSRWFWSTSSVMMSHNPFWILLFWSAWIYILSSSGFLVPQMSLWTEFLAFFNFVLSSDQSWSLHRSCFCQPVLDLGGMRALVGRWLKSPHKTTPASGDFNFRVDGVNEIVNGFLLQFLLISRSGCNYIQTQTHLFRSGRLLTWRL